VRVTRTGAGSGAADGRWGLQAPHGCTGKAWAWTVAVQCAATQRAVGSIQDVIVRVSWIVLRASLASTVLQSFGRGGGQRYGKWSVLSTLFVIIDVAYSIQI
jgi:hypothetical protein